MALGSAADIIADFGKALDAAGLRPRGGIKADGNLHRCAAGERENLNGYYVLHLDGAVPAGAYGDWKSGLKETWKANGASISDFDRAELVRKVEADRRRREREKAKRHKDTAESAAMLWRSYKPAPADHPYLVRKQVLPHGARIDPHGNLVTSVADAAGEIWSLQTIAADGEKRFMPGGRNRRLHVRDRRARRPDRHRRGHRHRRQHPPGDRPLRGVRLQCRQPGACSSSYPREAPGGPHRHRGRR